MLTITKFKLMIFGIHLLCFRRNEQTFCWGWGHRHTTHGHDIKLRIFQGTDTVGNAFEREPLNRRLTIKYDFDENYLSTKFLTTASAFFIVSSTLVLFPKDTKASSFFDESMYGTRNDQSFLSKTKRMQDQRLDICADRGIYWEQCFWFGEKKLQSTTNKQAHPQEIPSEQNINDKTTEKELGLKSSVIRQSPPT